MRAEKASIGGMKLAINQKGYIPDAGGGITSMIPMLNVPSSSLMTFGNPLS
jgi:hypothetical protein